MIITETQRLRFDFMTKDDAISLFELDQDVEVMRFINGGKMTSMDDIESIAIPRLQSYANQVEGWGIWKVSLNDLTADTMNVSLGLGTKERLDTYLGWILVRPMDFFSDKPQWDNLELGWRFKQAAWGKGFATEAAFAVMNVVSQSSKINKISAIAIEENVGSINIMKKLGMSFLKKGIHKDPLGDMELVFYQMMLSKD
ncbi:GNAT family N-acetyltransferase [Shewanella eurypsychrophilus]|uniref:GNAT family N-acetyltransferase n=1 Tax=Shewanella eurypsychrophilus TaxID=2593656 RepID=A0ABX6V8C7_9GAMM|nr:MULTISPECIES: GNAT family N-acetyltransferase [Shewanella]QFU22837.1 GNAT family N-acetyltransferase [Shewanella sp. YLB-09]QPG58124.1 GNAT family N-acetyltransferase [Shewanella eurypsychrophilus]